jgi:hypothetical protein
VSQYDDLLTAAERKYGLPAGLLSGQMSVESGGDKGSKSSKGALGLMQFTPATAKAYGVDVTDPASSIDGAARFMADNLKATKGNVSEALRLYQGGPNRAGWGAQNAAYAGKVLGAMPGDSGDLAAMGLSSATNTGTTVDDHDDLAASGLSVPDDKGVKGAQAEIAALGSDPALMAAPGSIQQGLNASIAAAGKDPSARRAAADQFLASHGYDPTKTTTLDENLAYQIEHPKYQIPWEQPGTDKGAPPPVSSTPLKPSDSTLTNLRAGADQGVRDVTGTIARAGQYVENKVPILRTLDQGFSKLTGLPTADQMVGQSNLLRSVYDQTAGQTLAGGLGRVGGNLLVVAPAIALTGGVAGAGLDAIGAGGLADFAGGTASGNMLTRGASMAASGVLQAAAGAALTSSGSDRPLGDQIKTGAEFGAPFGVAAGALGGAGNKIMAAIAPKLDPETAQLAQYADAAGIKLRGGQITNNPLVRRIDAQAENNPFNGIAEQNAGQRDAFTAAVGRTFGADAPRLTPEVMSAAKEKLGDTFNRVANNTKIQVDDHLIDHLASIESDAHQVVAGSEMAPLRTQLNNVISKITGTGDGKIDGGTYQAITRHGAPLDRAMSSSDPNVAYYAGQIRTALDDALERSANPADLADLRAARLGYKNMKTVEPLASKGDGTISPALLNSRVTATFKNRAYTGAGDLGDLATVGQRFLKPPSSSGTAENMKAQKLIDGGATAIGLGAGLAGHMAGAPVPLDIGLALAGAGSGTVKGVANAIVAKALKSPSYRNKLVASALNGGNGVARPTGGNYLPAAILGTNNLIQQSGGNRR